jgi:hypothetical protein
MRAGVPLLEILQQIVLEGIGCTVDGTRAMYQPARLVGDAKDALVRAKQRRAYD